MTRRPVAHAVARCLLSATGLVFAAQWLPAQTLDFGRPSTWDSVSSVTGVSASEMQWLRLSLSADEATDLFARVSALSRPEAAQLIPGFLDLDGTINFPASFIRPLADSMGRRPPPGTPGLVHVAYLAARFRVAETTWHHEHGGAYQMVFTGRHYIPLPHADEWLAAAKRRGLDLHLGLDFAPAETLLAILRTPGLSVGDAKRRISTPAFDALITHRSQSFYAIPLSREQLAWNLVCAATTDPLTALYRYEHPGAFYHFGDVVEHEQQFVALLSELERNRAAMLAEVAARIVPYVPNGTTLTRNVAVYFADMSNGWGTNRVTALDIEYYKDDFPRLMDVMTHETFHAAQAAARRDPKTPAPIAAADSDFVSGLEEVYLEGVTSYVAEGLDKIRAQTGRVPSEGAALLDSLLQAPHVPDSAARARALLDHGVAGGGPFYILGAAMSKVIVDVLGRDALANTLRGGGVPFFATYLRAQHRVPSAKHYLSPAVESAVRRVVAETPS